MEIIRRLHKWSYSENERYQLKQNNIFLWFIYNITFRTCNLLMAIYLFLYKLLGMYPKPLNGKKDLIISLTSFPKRIETVWQVIDSMFHQTIQPEKIYLYLTDEEFPRGKEALPKRLLEYEKLGLEICFRKYNLMPHNKYFYALQEHSDKCTITIDDDMYYHADLIENLWSLYSVNTKCICANTITIIPKEESLMWKYNSWKHTNEPTFPSLCNVALGYNGILYPPHIFHSKDIFNIEKISMLSPKADDLWLKIHEIIENIPVVSNGYYCSGIQLIGTQSVSLMSSNVGTNQNDLQWKMMCEHYMISFKNTFNRNS